MADLFVDVDALSELSRQLDSIKRALEEAGDVPDAYEGRLGPSRIEDTVHDFVSGWKDGRRKILEGIDGLKGRVQGAIDTYQQQEAEISRAAGGGAG